MKKPTEKEKAKRAVRRIKKWSRNKGVLMRYGFMKLQGVGIALRKFEEIIKREFKL